MRVTPALLLSLTRPRLLAASFRSFSGKPVDPYDGYTRSIHVKQKFVEIKKPDGTIKKVPSGLVDNTNEWLGDQFTSLHLKITNEYDWTLEGFAERARKRLLARNKRRQMISIQSIQHLGLDLAVAHMICNLGGRVQFVGSDRWFQRYNNGPSDLPNCYVGDLKLEAIDASGTPIMYEGFKLFCKFSSGFIVHIYALRILG
ncbi:hypothetical protein AAHC03_014 [Spirometra sp. Aus1]